MFTVASYIVTKYSNMPFPDFVKKRIFTPLGMNETTFYHSQVKHPANFSQTFTPDGRRIPWWFPDETINLIGGPGSIITNVIDMVSAVVCYQ